MDSETTDQLLCLAKLHITKKGYDYEEIYTSWIFFYVPQACFWLISFSKSVQNFFPPISCITH
jgi:hypothetical protein